MTALDEFTTAVWQNPSIQKIIARAMSRPDWPTFKFTDEMVRDSKPLWDWAEWLVDQYVGSFHLMVDLHTKQRTGVQLREGQLRTALNTLLNCWRKSLQETKIAQQRAADPNAKAEQYRQAFTSKPVFVKVEQRSIFDEPVDLQQIPTSPIMQRELNPELIAPSKAGPPVVQLEVVSVPPKGTYTYVDGAGDYRVLRFEELKGGAVSIAYQFGPDNTFHFRKCGIIKANGELKVWQHSFKGGTKQALSHVQRANIEEAVRFICSMDKDGQLKAGEAYALRSKRCFRCGKELTVVSSISAGMGPICANSW